MMPDCCRSVQLLFQRLLDQPVVLNPTLRQDLADRLIVWQQRQQQQPK